MNKEAKEITIKEAKEMAIKEAKEMAIKEAKEVAIKEAAALKEDDQPPSKEEDEEEEEEEAEEEEMRSGQEGSFGGGEGEEWVEMTLTPTKNKVSMKRGTRHCGANSGHFETSIIHFPTSEGVSERANERVNG